MIITKDQGSQGAHGAVRWGAAHVVLKVLEVLEVLEVIEALEVLRFGTWNRANA